MPWHRSSSFNNHTPITIWLHEHAKAAGSVMTRNMYVQAQPRSRRHAVHVHTHCQAMTHIREHTGATSTGFGAEYIGWPQTLENIRNLMHQFTEMTQNYFRSRYPSSLTPRVVFVAQPTFRPSVQFVMTEIKKESDHTGWDLLCCSCGDFVKETKHMYTSCNQNALTITSSFPTIVRI